MPHALWQYELVRPTTGVDSYPPCFESGLGLVLLDSQNVAEVMFQDF